MPRDLYMIIGGDGLLGRALRAHLEARGLRVAATTRRGTPLGERSLHLDLQGDVSRWEIPEETRVAFLLAAVTSTRDCRRDPAGSRRINVEGTVTLGTRLLERGIPVVFTSTNLVFDGTTPLPRPEDPVRPLGEYGRQKAAAEKALLERGEGVSVVRLTKVLSRETPLVARWREALAGGETVRPFRDMWLAPLSPGFTVAAVAAIAESGLYGIWHLSPGEQITYETLAREMARSMGADGRCIHAVTVREAGLETEGIPRYATLDASRLERELGLPAPGIRDALAGLTG